MTQQTTVDSTIRGAPLEEEAHGALTLGGFLREVAHQHASREALVFHPPSGPVVRLSYNDVWNQAYSLARALVARGVTKETRVGLLATNRPEWIVAVFGIALAGGTGVIMSTFAKGPELADQLRMGDVSLLIFERSVIGRDFAAELIDLCPELGGTSREIQSTRFPFLRRAICIDDGQSPGAPIELWSDVQRSDLKAPAELIDAIGNEVAPTDRGLVFFSSGSTAKPKVIMHAHRAATLQLWRQRRIFAVDSSVRTWTANGFFFSGNFCMAIGSTLGVGGCLVLQRYFAPDEALRLMQSERVTMPIAWPHQWMRLVEDPAFKEVDLSSLHYVGAGSAMRTHPTVKTDWHEPMSAYGNTETFTIICIHPSGTPEEICAGNHGVPQPGVTIRIVDPETGRVLQRNEVGEIAVKSATLMLGYLRIPPEETFDDEGFFRTGDGGFVNDKGQLVWQGRLNDIIKTGGANVSPVEINSVLFECPGVKIVATVGVPHDTLGEVVVACVVPEEGVVIDESAVKAFASKRLSSYKVPRRVLFFAESDLTLTGSNKVKIAPLRELAARRLAAG